MTVSVTANHIKRGHRHASRSCPIALALKDAGFTYPSAGSTSCGGSIDGEVWRAYRLPASAQAFVHAYDNELDVSPFTFELSTPLPI